MLEGKTVSIKDPSLLQFFYPEFEIKDKLSFLDSDKKVIYVGKIRPNLKSYLQQNTKEFINTVGKVDVDLTIPSNLVDFVYSRHGKTPPNTVKESLDLLDEEEILYCCKIVWVSGRWPYAAGDSDLTIYNLFQATTGSTKELLQTYFKLISQIPFYIVESSFMTFLMRAKTVEDQEVSPVYKRLLKSFYTKSGNKISKAVFQYMQKDKLRDELRFLELLLGLR